MKGFISEDEVAVTIPALRAGRDAVREELASCEAKPIVLQLHPTAVASYLDAVTRIDAELERDAADGETDSRAAFRYVVEPVVVHAPTADSGV